MSFVIKDNCHTRLMLYLITYSVDIQSKDDKERAPLAQAAQGSLTSVVRLASQKGRCKPSRQPWTHAFHVGCIGGA